MDYLAMNGNFSPNYLSSAAYLAGYFDPWNVGVSDYTGENSSVFDSVETPRMPFAKTSDDKWSIYELLFRPPVGILNSTKPLLPKTEFVLSFDRAVSDLAMIKKTIAAENPLDGEVIPLENVFLRATYYTSPYLRNHFSSITEKEIIYEFDEMSIYQKNIPQGITTVRFPNIIGGNTPTHLFAGIIKSSALMGDCALSSTCFKQNMVTEFDLTLDGASVQGFPIRTDNSIPALAYDSYLKATNRAFNNKVSDVVPIRDYSNFHLLYGHKFSGEQSTTGWIGINLKLEKEYEENYVLGLPNFTFVSNN